VRFLETARQKSVAQSQLKLTIKDVLEMLNALLLFRSRNLLPPRLLSKADIKKNQLIRKI
jgi:hypothetical protein